MISVSEEERKPPEKPSIPDEILILPSGDAVLYPSMIVPLSTGEEKTVKLRFILQNARLYSFSFK